MAGGNVKGISVEIGGNTTKLTKALNSVRRETNSVQKELKEVERLLKLDPGNVELLAQKEQLLAKQFDITKSKLEGLRKAKELTDKDMQNGTEVNEKEYRLLQREIVNTEQALKQMENATESVNDAIDKVGKSADDTGDSLGKMSGAEKNISGTGKALGALKTIGSGVGTAMTAVAGATAAAGGALIAAAETTREYREDMNRLDAAFVSAGKTADSARQSYSDFYAVLGESDRSVEAVNHLAKLCNTEEELAQWSTICAGVSATFGDSLPIEGLTEAANETAKVGQVTGPLADALNWAGISEDKFNRQLALCNSEQERAALITSTLAGTYQTAAAEFENMNADVMASREATLQLNEAMATIGAAVEPILTKLKLMGAEAFEGIANGINLLLNGNIEEGINNLSSSISNALTIVTKTLGNALPTIMPIAVTIITELANALVASLPILVQTLVGNLPIFVDGLVQIFDGLVAALPGLVQILAGSLPTLIPQIVDGLVNMFVSVADYLPSIIQPLLAQLPAILETIASSLSENLPVLIGTLTNLIIGIVNMLPEMIEPIITLLPTLISSVIEALISNLPMIITGLAKIVAAIVIALPGILVTLGESFINIITTYFSAAWEGIKSIFSQLSPWFGEKFAEAGNAVKSAWNGITSFFGSIWGGIQGIFSSVGSWFLNKFTEAKTNITQAWNTVTSFFSDIWEKIKSVFQPGAFTEIGNNLVAGLWDGISSSWNWLIGHISDWCGNILDSVLSFFGINSPSRVMRDEVGAMLVEGIAVGIKENSGEVSEEFQKLLDDLKLQKDLNLVDEAEYYRELEKLRDTYLEKGTKDWWDYTKEIIDYESSLTDELKDNIISAYEDIADTAAKKIEDLQNKQESFAASLRRDDLYETNTLFTLNGEEFTETSLKNWDKENEKLRAYNDTLSQTSERLQGIFGEDTESYNAMLELLRSDPFGEGGKTLELMKNATDEELQKFVSGWQENQRLTMNIAEQSYQNEAEAVQKGFIDTLTEKLKNLPEEFKTTGETAAEFFGEGFMESIGTVLDGIKESLAATLGSMSVGDFSRSLSGMGASVDQSKTNNITINSYGNNPADMAWNNKKTINSLILAGEL